MSKETFALAFWGQSSNKNSTTKNKPIEKPIGEEPNALFTGFLFKLDWVRKWDKKCNGKSSKHEKVPKWLIKSNCPLVNWEYMEMRHINMKIVVYEHVLVVRVERRRSREEDVAIMIVIVLSLRQGFFYLCGSSHLRKIVVLFSKGKRTENWIFVNLNLIKTGSHLGRKHKSK